MLRRSILSAIAALFGGLGAKERAVAAEPARASIPAASAPAFPFPVVTVAGHEALAAHRRLKGEGRGWPLIVGGDEALARLAEAIEFEPRSPEAILEAAARVRMPDDLAARKQREWEAFVKDHPEFVDEGPGPEEGEWPSTGDTPDPPGDLQGVPLAATDILSGKYLPRVHIALIPTDEGAAVPAFLRYGNWNDCPAAEYHVAQLRVLHERYGFELIAIGPDTLEGYCERLPASREEATALARALHIYCNDTIDQGFNTVADYAHNLLTSRWRFFWWD